MKYIVGFSGGIDSSYTSFHLHSTGNEVLLIYLLTQAKIDESKEKHLKFIADKIGAKLIILDVFKEFKKEIIDNFVEYYNNGKTPNPCVLCNPMIKFLFLEKMRQQHGFDKIITGHYAKIFVKNNKNYIACASDIAKDQSYMLYRLSEFKDGLRLIDNIEFGLGDNKKSDVKEILNQNGLLTQENQKESQDICFIQDGDYVNFLNNNTNTVYPEGEIINLEGKVIGKHKGIIHYTIGQRSGLGINQKLYVLDIDISKNQIIAGEEKDLYKESLQSKNFFIHDELLDENDFKNGNIIGKIRYRHQGEIINSIEKNDENYIIRFKRPVRAITRGQHIVLYKRFDGETLVIGGGEII